MNVAIDLDGGLADNQHRLWYIQQEAPKNWDGFNLAADQDAVIEPMATLARALYAAGHGVEIWTGRSEAYRELAERWLFDNGILYETLRMRPDGDFRQAPDLRDLFLSQVSLRPDLVFEHNPQVASWWRVRGIVCGEV